MSDLPQESKGSFKEGIWFVFQHLGYIIVAGGKINGKEYVFVNDELVSEKRSIKTNSQHEFSYDNLSYRVIFNVNNVFTNNMDCSLFCSDEIVKALNAQLVFHPKQYSLELFLYLSIFVIWGVVLSFFEWPFYLLLLAWPIVFLLKFKSPSISFKISEKHA
ncbi:MAG: hypothetical protein AB2551_18260 [Candidatus Thiodiazotropha sp.]